MNTTATGAGISTATAASMDWRHRSACASEDPELFFPIGDSGSALLQIEEAKAVCSRCPVLLSCREWALITNQVHGVWGGLSGSDREQLLRCAGRRTAAT